MRKKILFWIIISFGINHECATQSWLALGSGIGSSSYNTVHSLIVYNGELYAGGNFSTAGGLAVNNIAKWNGRNWASAGNGLNGSVHALASFNGELYAGGDFSNSGSPAVNVVKWLGSDWQAIGITTSSTVHSLIDFNGELYAAAWFPSLGSIDGYPIAKWNGTRWSAVGTGLDQVINFIRCMTVYNNELYIAGEFIGGGGVSAYAAVVKWNGIIWSLVARTPTFFPSDLIHDMAVYNGALYVAGTFSMIDSMPANRVARWDGTGWSAVGSGININYSGDENNVAAIYGTGDGCDGCEYGGSSVKALAVFNGNLYAGGSFDSCGTIATKNIAKWNGIAWSALGQGVDGPVNDLASDEAALFIGGNFNSIGGNITANNIVKWGCLSSLPKPANVFGDTIVCENTHQTYSINPVPGAQSYTWTVPTGWKGSSNTTTLQCATGKLGGSVAVFVNDGSCSSLPKLLTVSVKEAPQPPDTISGNDSTTTGQTVSYSVSSVNAPLTYQWSLSGGGKIVSGQNSNTIQVKWDTIGSYKVFVKALNLCGESTEQIKAVAVSKKVSLNYLVNSTDISILPNPSSGLFHIQSKGISNKRIKVQIINQSGQLVFSIEYSTSGNDAGHPININKMMQGIYFAKIFIDGKEYLKTIVITK